MRSQSQFYQIQIEGHSSLDWSDWFDALTVQHTENGHTLLAGSLPDQTGLHGVLMRIRDLGLTLVEVKRIPPTNQNSNQ